MSYASGYEGRSAHWSRVSKTAAVVSKKLTEVQVTGLLKTCSVLSYTSGCGAPSPGTRSARKTVGTVPCHARQIAKCKRTYSMHTQFVQAEGWALVRGRLTLSQWSRNVPDMMMTFKVKRAISEAYSNAIHAGIISSVIIVYACARHIQLALGRHTSKPFVRLAIILRTTNQESIHGIPNERFLYSKCLKGTAVRS